MYRLNPFTKKLDYYESVTSNISTVHLPNQTSLPSTPANGATLFASGNNIGILDVDGEFATINLSLMTANRSYRLPDKSGEFVLADLSTGVVTIGDANSGTLSANKIVTLQEVGDQFGNVSLTLKNRVGLNGMVLHNVGLDLVDFMAKGSGDNGSESTIRVEFRNDGARSPSNAGKEYQFGTVDDPAVYMGDGETGLLKGKLKTRAHYKTIVTDTDAATVTFDLKDDIHRVVLNVAGATRTFAVTNESIGQIFIIKTIQDGTGSRGIVWFSGITWANGNTVPTPTAAAGKEDIYMFVCVASGTYEGYVLDQNR